MRVNYCLTGARNCTVTLRALLCRTTSFTHQAYLNTTWFLGYWTVPAYCDVPTDLLHCLLGPVDDRGGLAGMRILRPNGCVFWSLGYAGLHTWLTLKTLFSTNRHGVNTAHCPSNGIPAVSAGLPSSHPSDVSGPGSVNFIVSHFYSVI